MTEKKPLKDPDGGLTAAGRKSFGGNLKPGVKNYSKASVSDKKRWISWALRFYGQDNYPPLKDDKGLPTRFALTAAAWGEPVPKTEAEARAIAAKARKRKEELANQELAQSSTSEFIEDFISHAGVKGMKWGVRKQIKKSNPSERKVRRKDKKWRKKATKTRTLVKLLNKSKRRSKEQINAINEKPEYKGKNLKKDPELRRRYNDEISRELTKSLNETSARIIGPSASNKRLELKYDMNDAGLTWKVVEGNDGRKSKR